ncbi:hypothetical protein HEL60_024015, partial [Escherichia coli]|nr:hypothetical protein [Escherichia coli]
LSYQFSSDGYIRRSVYAYDLITSMVASGYDYRRDDDAGLWSSADLTYVITYEM